MHEIKKGLRAHGLHTVCEEARCPNLSECFSKKTATFMIMGNICTRSCGFCSVANGKPLPLDPEEPKRVAKQALELNLKHVVVTSVTRDDLEDGGAGFFADTIKEIRYVVPDATVEVLTPDFRGEQAPIEKVCKAFPDVFNHNLETVERLTPVIRNKASYETSLKVLKTASLFSKTIMIKSGIMAGLGETEKEVIKTIRDLKDTGCDIITVGQYLRPTKSAVAVSEYVTPEQFDKYKKIGEEIGVKYMFCGPFVRSSYMAHEIKR